MPVLFALTGFIGFEATAVFRDEGSMLLDTADEHLGGVGRDVVNVLLLTSLFACVLSFHNVVARYQLVLANKGLLPERLGRVHPRHGSPAFSSVVQTVTALRCCWFSRPSGSTRSSGSSARSRAWRRSAW